MAGIFFLIALVAALYLFFSAKGPIANSNIEWDSATTAVLEDINSGSSSINFVLGECPLVVKDGERVVAALPNTALLEPLTIRVRDGNRHHSSFATGRSARASWGSSSYTSEFAPHDELRQADVGTFILTDRRLVFMGALKTLVVDLSKIMGVDHLSCGIAVHCEGKEDVDSFKIAQDLKLPYLKDGKALAVPFSGPILERVVSHAMAKTRSQHAASAA
jgi:hypothetical protein